MSNSLTSKKYWEQFYKTRAEVKPINIEGVRGFCANQIFNIKKSIDLESKRVIEIGGGGSPWLAFLAKEIPSASFFCLDYAEEGLASLARFCEYRNIENIDFIKKDMFDVGEDKGKYDVVFSHGVVEHFSDITAVLRAHSMYLATYGKMLTIIPNMCGVPGFLTRLMNKEVYDVHVPHDLNSFVRGHKNAGLEVIEAGYLCSNNFSVLASCVSQKSGLIWNFYKMLARLSKALWFIEKTVHPLPSSATFSPYIYVVSQREST